MTDEINLEICSGVGVNVPFDNRMLQSARVRFVMVAGLTTSKSDPLLRTSLKPLQAASLNIGAEHAVSPQPTGQAGRWARSTSAAMRMSALSSDDRGILSSDQDAWEQRTARGDAAHDVRETERL